MSDADKKALVDKLLKQFENLEQLYTEYRKSKEAKLISLKVFRGEIAFEALVAMEKKNTTIDVLGFAVNCDGKKLTISRRAFSAEIMGKEVSFEQVTQSIDLP